MRVLGNWLNRCDTSGAMASKSVETGDAGAVAGACEGTVAPEVAAEVAPAAGAGGAGEAGFIAGPHAVKREAAETAESRARSNRPRSPKGSIRGEFVRMSRNLAPISRHTFSMPPVTPRDEIDRIAAIEWYRRNRRRTEELFSLIPDESWLDRPIPLRNPICFYEGHIPAFGVNTLWKRALGHPAIRPEFEVLFERGIDPEEAPSGRLADWPSRSEVRRYAGECDEALERALREEPIVSQENPLLRGAQAVFTVLEHEVMHQETLHYMWRREPYGRKRRPAGSSAPSPQSTARVVVRPGETERIPAGRATLGADPGEIPFGWDNEFPRRTVFVPEFEIGVQDVTNAEFLEFVDAGGYRDESLWSPDGWKFVAESGARHPSFWSDGEEQGKTGWQWIGMFEKVALPLDWPVWVTHAEASAYALWKGMGLPSEAQYHRAAFGEPSGSERAFPWGDEPPDSSRGNFDFEHWEPVAVGSYPRGVSAWGIHDLVGNGWEWTSTVFEGFPGFQPMASYPQYSADFFDGKHYVMKGASPVTGRELVRRTLRNWFRPNYPHVYASFRCVKDVG
jgi:iron(II)-dependent oxidoreductase